MLMRTVLSAGLPTIIIMATAVLDGCDARERCTLSWVMTLLCIRWVAVDPNTGERHLPLVSQWRWCSDTRASDQIKTARELGLLENLNLPPHPPPAAAGVAIR